MWKVPKITSRIGKVGAKFLSRTAGSIEWCQRWKTGLAMTYLSGPKVQLRLAWTTAPMIRLIGAMAAKAAGEKPISRVRIATDAM